MKRIINFFILVLFSGISSLTAQNCSANYQYWQNGATVNFQDSSFSSNGNHSYYWSFGDGSFSNLSNPSHTYNQSGQYRVCLTIADSLCTDSICNFIAVIVPNPCSSSFTYSVGQTTNVTFTNTTSPSSGLFYSWDFGDGSPADTAKSPTHFYTNSGIYIVTLSATGNGQSCVFTDTIFVKTCDAQFSYQADSLGNVNFFNQSILSSRTFIGWDFGDGNSSNLKNPKHQYLLSGSYAVTLTYFDSLANCSDSHRDTLSIAIPQFCQAGFTSQVNYNQVQFISIASNYTDISYLFGDGNSSIQPNPSHTYVQSGTYTVCQKVTDSITNCSSTYCDTIVISLPQPCQSGFTYSLIGDTVFFQSTASNYTRLVYRFGDGDTSILENPLHVYPSSNQYLVTQIVYNDSTGCSDTTSQFIWATNSGTCVARYQIAIDTTLKSTLFLINQSTDASSHQYIWDFGDGSIGYGRIPTHLYNQNKAYKICLTIKDTLLNCISTYCDSVGLDTNGNVLKSSGGFFLKVLNGGAIGIQEVYLDQFITVYPNPVQSNLTIRSMYADRIVYQLFGIDGVAYQNGIITLGEEDVSLKDLPKGMYFLQLTDGVNRITKKIIKQ